MLLTVKGKHYYNDQGEKLSSQSLSSAEFEYYRRKLQEVDPVGAIGPGYLTDDEKLYYSSESYQDNALYEARDKVARRKWLMAVL